MNRTGKRAIQVLTGAGIGAALMFVLDPANGRRRRALARDKMVSTWGGTTEALRKRARDISNRARGIAASTRSVLRREEAVPADVLRARIRARIGHVVTHPGAVDITADENGNVVLSGAVLAGEVDSLISAVSGVKGVREVRHQLQSGQEQTQRMTG